MKQILDRLKLRANKAEDTEKVIMLEVYEELLEKYYCKELQYRDIDDIIQYDIFQKTPMSVKDFWKLKTLSEIYRNKTCTIKN